MTSAADYDIEVYVGDTWPTGPPGTEFLATVNDVGGDAIDFTGATASGLVKVRYSDSDDDAVATFTVDIKDQTTNTGEIGLSLPSTETVNLQARTYYWDLELQWSSETPPVVLTVLAGKCRVSGGVTD